MDFNFEPFSLLSQCRKGT